MRQVIPDQMKQITVIKSDVFWYIRAVLDLTDYL